MKPKQKVTGFQKWEKNTIPRTCQDVSKQGQCHSWRLRQWSKLTVPQFCLVSSLRPIYATSVARTNPDRFSQTQRQERRQHNSRVPIRITFVTYNWNEFRRRSWKRGVEEHCAAFYLKLQVFTVHGGKKCFGPLQLFAVPHVTYTTRAYKASWQGFIIGCQHVWGSETDLGMECEPRHRGRRHSQTRVMKQ